MNAPEAWRARAVSARDAVRAIRPGDHVFVGTASATPRALLAALEALDETPGGVELLHFLADGPLPGLDGPAGAGPRYRHRAFFVGQTLRGPVRQGLADYVPQSLVRVPELIANGRIPVDVALVQVAPPDAQGRCSLGVSVDITAAALARARTVIAEINPAMPRTQGHEGLPLARIDHLVLVDTPVIEYQHQPVADETLERMARYISSLVDDGSTLHIGLGRYPGEVLRHLSDRRDLGIHTDVLTDAVLPLLQRGVVTGALKTHEPGRIVASYAVGSRALYDFLHDNPAVSMQPIEQVCAPAVLAAQRRLVSVTQAFAVDLTGQACTDQPEGQFYGGLAAQHEFLQAAAHAPGGKAILCLSSRDEASGRSRIRARLDAGEAANIPRHDVHYVVTEYGTAYLFGKSVRERVISLIQIAHPEAREGLLREAQALGYVPADQQLRNRRAYAVQDERSVTLKDGSPVLLRPVTAADADALRALFHRLPERDVYTRFFRRLRSLNNRDVQRLCNLDDELELGLVAATGPREQPVLIGHAMYVLDPGTNLGETAFLVDAAQRGSGLGRALQQHLATLAQARGVRGFVAETMASNAAMLGLARALPGTLRREDLGGTWRIEVLFPAPWPQRS